MQFVQATFLAATAAVAIPVIVHLMFRSQARRVNLGTLRFLKQVLERNAQRQRIMRWLLLALRMAAVAVLGILFARPYFLEAALGGDRTLLLILIDHSASMDLKGEQGRLIEQAIAEAREIISEQGSKTRVEVAFFDDVVRPLKAADSENEGANEANRDSALTLLDAQATPRPSYRATNYGAAISWARDLSIRIPATRQELHIFTDLQQSGLDWSEVAPLPQQVDVQLHDLGRVAVNNLAVADARALPADVRPGDGTVVQATLLNSGPFPIAEQSVSLRLESGQKKQTFKSKVRLDPGSTGNVSFDIPFLDEGLWLGTVSLDVEDDLTFDNSRFIAIRSAPPQKVLIVDGQPQRIGLLDESYYLATALRLAGPEDVPADAPFDVDVVPLAADSALPSFNGFRVVVLVNPSAIRSADALRLSEYVSQGGGLVVFGGDLVSAESCETLASAGLTPGKIAGPTLSSDLPFRIDTWDQHHPLLSPFNDPQHGDLRRLAFRGYTRLVTPEGATDSSANESAVTVLASFRSGDPVLTHQRIGEGEVLWCAVAADRAWGEWVGSGLYVPLVHQLIGQPLGLNDGGPIRPLVIDADSHTAPDYAPGVVEHTRYWEVANVSPRESETERTTVEDFAERFQLTLQTEDMTPVESATFTRAEMRPDEQWHFAALAVMGLMLAEFFVANRTVS